MDVHPPTTVIVALAALALAAGCGKDSAREESAARPEQATTQSAEKEGTGTFSERPEKEPVPFSSAPPSAAATKAADPAGRPKTAHKPSPLIRLGDHAMARGDYATAADTFRRALAADPKDLDALRGLATALVALKQYARAVAVYDRTLVIAPTNRTARFNLAVALSRLKHFDRAERTYLQLLKTHPDDVRSRYNLASVYQAQGKLTEARRMWRGVLRRAPHLAGAHAALGQVLMDLGEHENAITAYAAAANLRGSSVDDWKNVIAAAEAAGSYGRALAAAERVTRLAPNDAGAWATLGNVHLTLHRATGNRPFLAKAVAAWRRSLALKPGQKQLRKYVETYGSVVADDGSE